MGQPDCYFSSLAEELEGKRDRMAAILKQAGMSPVIPEGGYFMLADVTALSKQILCCNNESNEAFFKMYNMTGVLTACILVLCRSGSFRHGR